MTRRQPMASPKKTEPTNAAHMGVVALSTDSGPAGKVCAALLRPKKGSTQESKQATNRVGQRPLNCGHC
jgi:hypothetical protein